MSIYCAFVNFLAFSASRQYGQRNLSTALLASFAQAFGIVWDCTTSEQHIRVATNPLQLAALWRGSIYVCRSTTQPHAIYLCHR